MTGTIIVAATLDTKGWHASVVADELAERGAHPLVVDCSGVAPGGRIESSRAHPLVTRDEVERRGLAGRSWPADRAERLAVMAGGLADIVRERLLQDDLAGLIALGGGSGATIAGPALGTVPFGVPSMLVSTGVNGDVEAIAGDTDVTLVQPAVDLLGRSAAVETVLRRSAAAMAAMTGIPAVSRRAPTVAITAFGVTTPAAEAVAALLSAHDVEAVVLHARGSGGRTLERLVSDGLVDAVLDLTTTEIIDEVAGGMRSAGPHRLDAALGLGIPLVLVPGALDVINFGAPASVPDRLSNRARVAHSAGTTLIRSSPEENRRAADWVADKVLAHPAAVRVLIPSGGFSALDAPGEPFWDPTADAAFTTRLIERLGQTVPVDVAPDHINDPAFAELVIRTLSILDPHRFGAVTA